MTLHLGFADAKCFTEDRQVWCDDERRGEDQEEEAQGGEAVDVRMSYLRIESSFGIHYQHDASHRLFGCSSMKLKGTKKLDAVRNTIGVDTRCTARDEGRLSYQISPSSTSSPSFSFFLSPSSDSTRGRYMLLSAATRRTANRS